MPVFHKESAEKFSYSLAWDLGPRDRITSSTWTATPAGLVLSGQTFDNSANPKTTTVWVAGGADGTDYSMANAVVTALGREERRYATVRVGPELAEGVSVVQILDQLPGGDAISQFEAHEVVEGWVGRLKAKNVESCPDEPFARSVVRKGAKAELWGEILRRSGRLAADETTREEARAEKLLEEYAAAKALPAERVHTRPILRG